MAINPLVLASLINAGSRLLGGLLGGAGQAKARKQMLAGTKPTTPYYETFRTLPVLQTLLNKSILGAMNTQLGSDTLRSWGIDLNSILNQKSRATQANTLYSPLLTKYWRDIDVAK